MDALHSGDIHLNMHFNYSPIASHKFLEVKDLEIGYTFSLLPAMNFSIKSGDRLAITGFNGIGKSTLLKTLIGELHPICGDYKFVEDARIAYFEQEHHFDDPNITPVMEISNNWPDMDQKDIRANLAKCGITGGLALQPIKTLSGGEQAKLKLCKLMLCRSNVLVLDEPTNHLDRIAQEDLLTALKKYQGTIIFVSHEKWFIEELANVVYDIEELLVS